MYNIVVLLMERGCHGCKHNGFLRVLDCAF